MLINTTRIKNKITQLTYRPKRSILFSSKTNKYLDEINKFLDDEIPSISRKKNNKSKSDDGEKETGESKKDDKSDEEKDSEAEE